MKRGLLIVVTFALLATSVSVAGAWTVTIKNSCDRDVQMKIEGEHLFWRQLDCTVDVPKEQTRTCEMPGRICPATFETSWKTDDGNEHHIFRDTGAACWNVIVDVVKRVAGGVYCVPDVHPHGDFDHRILK